MIRKLRDFILEKINYIFSRMMRIKDLIDDVNNLNLYSEEDIRYWMNKYDFDDMAKCIFITDEKIKDKKSDILNMRLSSKDILNKNYFNGESNDKDGQKIEESEIKLENNINIYLYVFRKGSNAKNRARQIRGFMYEGEMIRRHKLIKGETYTHKWDAYGSINKSYLIDKLDENKQIQYFNGLEYVNIDDLDDFSKISDVMFKNINWNIKHTKIGNEIAMADYKRISGLDVIDNTIIKRNTRTKDFIFSVGFHDDTNIIEEYLILIDIDKWESYLPNMNDDNTIEMINNMYSEIKNNKLNGIRTVENEKNWSDFISKYSVLTVDNLIKLRFKRDSKGQLRIQSSIPNKNFYNIILKDNIHLKIS